MECNKIVILQHFFCKLTEKKFYRINAWFEKDKINQECRSQFNPQNQIAIQIEQSRNTLTIGIINYKDDEKEIRGESVK